MWKKELFLRTPGRSSPKVRFCQFLNFLSATISRSCPVPSMSRVWNGSAFSISFSTYWDRYFPSASSRLNANAVWVRSLVPALPGTVFGPDLFSKIPSCKLSRTALGTIKGGEGYPMASCSDYCPGNVEANIFTGECYCNLG